jgi:hypothetical protein
LHGLQNLSSHRKSKDFECCLTNSRVLERSALNDGSANFKPFKVHLLPGNVPWDEKVRRYAITHGERKIRRDSISYDPSVIQGLIDLDRLNNSLLNMPE